MCVLLLGAWHYISYMKEVVVSYSMSNIYQQLLYQKLKSLALVTLII